MCRKFSDGNPRMLICFSHILLSTNEDQKGVEGGQFYGLSPNKSEIFLLLDMDKNIWEQVSAVLECRETGEPLNVILALSALISLDEGCGPFIMLFLLFKKLPQSIRKTFLEFVV